MEIKIVNPDPEIEFATALGITGRRADQISDLLVRASFPPDKAEGANLTEVISTILSSLEDENEIIFALFMFGYGSGAMGERTEGSAHKKQS